MAEQVPSVGRVVHYIDTNGKHYPATVVDVYEFAEGQYSLVLFAMIPPKADFIPDVHQGTGVGSWHWPEYVPAKP